VKIDSKSIRVKSQASSVKSFTVVAIKLSHMIQSRSYRDLDLPINVVYSTALCMSSCGKSDAVQLKVSQSVRVFYHLMMYRQAISFFAGCAAVIYIVYVYTIYLRRMLATTDSD